MKNKKILMITLSLIIILSVSFFYILEVKKFRPFNEGLKSFSKSVLESKKRDVYLDNMYVTLSLDTVISFITILPKNTWIEKIWYKGTFEGDTKLDPHTLNYQICLKVNNNLQKYGGIHSTATYPRWHIGNANSNNHGFTLRDSILYNWIYQLFPNDTLVYPIYIYEAYKKKKNVGSITFHLEKKNNE